MKIRRLLLSCLFIALCVATASAQVVITEPPKLIPLDPLVEKERASFNQLLLENPNYFGDEPNSKLPPVTVIKANTKYEELMRVAFLPQRDLLHGFINVKLPYGFLGQLCQAGSTEYIRFFADWNNDNDFQDEGEDLGLASVNVHDIPDNAGNCLSFAKPLTYTVVLKINSRKYICEKENLVRVRAILSWEKIPPAGNSLYPPVWGNVKDSWIQIKPVFFLTPDLVKDKTELYQFDPFTAQYYIDPPLKDKPVLTPEQLKSLYANQSIVTPLRYDLNTIYDKIKPYIEEKVTVDPFPETTTYGINPKYKEIFASINPELVTNPQLRYEQLNTVGLQYDFDTLSAGLTVKLPCGYSGDLCARGSFEYVAFWLYVYDEIEQMCFWHYVGTAQINVHDIYSIPRAGLEYAVNFPAGLDDLKKVCDKPVVLKVRGILSWGIAPPVNNPYYLPVWGNRKDANIQLKPGDYPYGENTPVISSVGRMAVEKISGNELTVVPSSIGDGYANGISTDGGFKAIESPFGRLITITGHIAYPPDDPAAGAKLQYKVQYRKPGASGWTDITNRFAITITTVNGSVWSSSSKYQVATGGYYTYEEDFTGSIQRFVENNTLAQWQTPMPEKDGLYELRVLVRDSGAPVLPDVPAGHLVSKTVKIVVDNTVPEADISLVAGDCTKFYINDIISGTFTALDKHIWKYELYTLPETKPLTIIPNGKIFPALVAPGLSNEPFNIYTTGEVSCGYVARIKIWDRTIVDNHMDGWQSSASVGFCLLD